MTKPSHSSPGSNQPRSRSDVGRTGGNRRTGDYPRGADALLPSDGAPVRPAPEARRAGRVALSHVVREYRRIHGEHGHLEATARRPRRHLETEMDALAATFERLLAEWIPATGEQAAWRAALHGHAEIPETSGAAGAPVSRLIFRGRSAPGVGVDVRESAEGQIEIDLDGQPSERLVDRLHLAVDADGWVQIDDVRAQETFDLPAPAAHALRRWVRDGGAPPWEHVASLLAEGLVDEHFALTDRGRRAGRHAAG